MDRIQSTFIDTLFILLLMFAFANLLDKFETVPDWVRISLFVGLFILYEPICVTIGATLGNFIKGIRVRSIKDQTKKITLLQAFIRYPVKIGLGWISFLTINTNPHKRAIHDLVSGSVMIKA